jgi:signal transduction histidine kinase
MAAGECLIQRSKLCSVSVLACLAAVAIAALTLPQSFALTALSDVIQCLLLASGTIAFVPRAVRSEGKLRLFWTLMAMGVGFWFFYQLSWTYFEVVLRQDVPDLFAGDIVIFLHLVPLMAALALRPHVPRDEYAARLGRLDFALMTVWWIYLYVLLVMPWQYAVADLPAYNRNLNAVYLAEKMVFLVALEVFRRHSWGPWKIFYANLLGASLLYSASSYVANWALARHVYYSGSLYDIPLVASMAWITLIGLWTRAADPDVHSTEANGGRVRNSRGSAAYGVWVARFGMIAVFSLPLFAAWSLFDIHIPAPVRSFRLALTLGAALLMSGMVFARQRLMDRELVRLLQHSQESFESLKRLQAQVLQSEKVASVGQLVGGAAHELNNPITAMLGYSDLLLNTQLTTDGHTLAAKISQQVRRTRSLVASLLSFARRAPASRIPIDLNTLARTAVKLTQPQWQALKISVRMEFDAELPRLLGDSNQLLQACLQIVGTGLHFADEHGSRSLTIATEAQDGMVVLEVSEGTADAQPAAALPAFSTSESADLSDLSACQGIAQEHMGRIVCRRQPSGANTIRMELPANAPGSARKSEPKVPALWQSQPYA